MTLAVPTLSNPLSRITSRLLYLTRSSTWKPLKNDVLPITPFK